MGTEWLGLENRLCGGNRAWEKGGEVKERPRGEEQAPQGYEGGLDLQSSVQILKSRVRREAGPQNRFSET